MRALASLSPMSFERGGDSGFDRASRRATRDKQQTNKHCLFVCLFDARVESRRGEASRGKQTQKTNKLFVCLYDAEDRAQPSREGRRREECTLFDSPHFCSVLFLNSDRSRHPPHPCCKAHLTSH